MSLDPYLHIREKLEKIGRLLRESNRNREIQEEIEQLLKAANGLGERLCKEARQLSCDFDLLCQHPSDPKLRNKLLNDILRISRDCREI